MKTLFMTGATGAIGAAIQAKFIAQQYTVIAPTRAELDLADSESVARYLQNFKHPLDVFIHCAGFNEPKPIHDISMDDFSKTMQINAVSYYQMTQSLLQQQALNQGGHILGLSSIYGAISRKGRFSYAASKHCLNGMTKTLALELGHLDIKVNTIAPGFVDTPLTRKNNSPEKIEEFKKKIPLARLATAADIAEVAYFLCSPQNQFITGQEIIVDGGYTIGGFEQ